MRSGYVQLYGAPFAQLLVLAKGYAFCLILCLMFLYWTALFVWVYR